MPITKKVARENPVSFFLAIAILLYLPVSAYSAQFVVTKTSDTNDGVCDTDCSLREAINAVNAIPSNDEIKFDPATFGTSRTIILTGGSLTINNNGGVWINGPGPDLLAISGNNAFRVIIVNNDSRAVISSVTVRDGNGHNIGAGGGIVNLGTLSLNNVTVRNNFGEPFGGGIYNQSNLLISACRIIDNNGDLYGGGIYNFNSPAVLDIYESTISGNTARRDGGGIYNNGKATIVGTTISGNIASSPGDGGNGGGIHTTGYVNQNSSVTVVNSTIANNVSLAGGGGILSDGSLVDLTNVTITGNSVTSALTYYYGGGVLNYQENYPGTIRAKNTIIADNTSANGQAPDFGGVLTTLGHNFIEKTHWTVFTTPPQTDIFGQDPLLGLLAANGGPTYTRMPQPGSPVIDKVGSDYPSTDQRFYSRPADGNGDGSPAGDIGAVEVLSSQALVTFNMSGRVSRGNFRSVYPAQVRLKDNLGNVRYGIVNQSGYYRFFNIPAGRTYMLLVSSKRGTYLPRVVYLMGNTANLDFTEGT